ncbi:hypothetical protein A3Q56_00954 [Intoshia linei]|uniref:Uncharacterized protein n=1 Tax=Intoshia linei TaxID=1819745 RepID=A0A177BAA5_9BILA|nr:hypothetical protein A3Q56_00954 [Intoshia linei]
MSKLELKLKKSKNSNNLDVYKNSKSDWILPYFVNYPNKLSMKCILLLIQDFDISLKILKEICLSQISYSKITKNNESKIAKFATNTLHLSINLMIKHENFEHIVPFFLKSATLSLMLRYTYSLTVLKNFIKDLKKVTQTEFAQPVHLTLESKLINCMKLYLSDNVYFAVIFCELNLMIENSKLNEIDFKFSNIYEKILENAKSLKKNAKLFRKILNIDKREHVSKNLFIPFKRLIRREPSKYFESFLYLFSCTDFSVDNVELLEFLGEIIFENVTTQYGLNFLIKSPNIIKTGLIFKDFYDILFGLIKNRSLSIAQRKLMAVNLSILPYILKCNQETTLQALLVLQDLIEFALGELNKDVWKPILVSLLDEKWTEILGYFSTENLHFILSLNNFKKNPEKLIYIHKFLFKISQIAKIRFIELETFAMQQIESFNSQIVNNCINFNVSVNVILCMGISIKSKDVSTLEILKNLEKFSKFKFSVDPILSDCILILIHHLVVNCQHIFTEPNLSVVAGILVKMLNIQNWIDAKICEIYLSIKSVVNFQNLLLNTIQQSNADLTNRVQLHISNVFNLLPVSNNRLENLNFVVQCMLNVLRYPDEKFNLKINLLREIGCKFYDYVPEALHVISLKMFDKLDNDGEIDPKFTLCLSSVFHNFLTFSWRNAHEYSFLFSFRVEGFHVFNVKDFCNEIYQGFEYNENDTLSSYSNLPITKLISLEEKVLNFIEKVEHVYDPVYGKVELVNLVRVNIINQIKSTVKISKYILYNYSAIFKQDSLEYVNVKANLFVITWEYINRMLKNNEIIRIFGYFLINQCILILFESSLNYKDEFEIISKKDHQDYLVIFRKISWVMNNENSKDLKCILNYITLEFEKKIGIHVEKEAAFNLNKNDQSSFISSHVPGLMAMFYKVCSWLISKHVIFTNKNIHGNNDTFLSSIESILHFLLRHLNLNPNYVYPTFTGILMCINILKNEKYFINESKRLLSLIVENFFKFNFKELNQQNQISFRDFPVDVYSVRDLLLHLLTNALNKSLNLRIACLDGLMATPKEYLIPSCFQCQNFPKYSEDSDKVKEMYNDFTLNPHFVGFDVRNSLKLTLWILMCDSYDDVSNISKALWITFEFNSDIKLMNQLIKFISLPPPNINEKSVYLSFENVLYHEKFPNFSFDNICHVDWFKNLIYPYDIISDKDIQWINETIGISILTLMEDLREYCDEITFEAVFIKLKNFLTKIKKDKKGDKVEKYSDTKDSIKFRINYQNRRRIISVYRNVVKTIVKESEIFQYFNFIIDYSIDFYSHQNRGDEVLLNDILSSCLNLLNLQVCTEQSIHKIVKILDEKWSKLKGSLNIISQQLLSVIFGSCAKYLDPSDERLLISFDRLYSALDTHSCQFQKTIADSMSLIVSRSRSIGMGNVKKIFNKTINLESPNHRVGMAIAFSRIASTLGIKVFDEFGFAIKLPKIMSGSIKQKHAALLITQHCTNTFGRVFEPYVLLSFPRFLNTFSDSNSMIKQQAIVTMSVVMSKMSGYGVSTLLPHLKDKLNENSNWKSVDAVCYTIGSMKNCQPRYFVKVLPSLIETLMVLYTENPDERIYKSASYALESLCSTIVNPETKKMSTLIVTALKDHLKTQDYLAKFNETQFTHTLDIASVFFMLPIIKRELSCKSNQKVRFMAAQSLYLMLHVCTNVLIEDFIPEMIPIIKLIIVNSQPDIRIAASKIVGSLFSRKEFFSEKFKSNVLNELMNWFDEQIYKFDKLVSISGVSHSFSAAITHMEKPEAINRLNTFMQKLESSDFALQDVNIYQDRKMDGIVIEKRLVCGILSTFTYLFKKVEIVKNEIVDINFVSNLLKIALNKQLSEDDLVRSISSETAVSIVRIYCKFFPYLSEFSKEKSETKIENEKIDKFEKSKIKSNQVGQILLVVSDNLINRKHWKIRLLALKLFHCVLMTFSESEQSDNLDKLEDDVYLCGENIFNKRLEICTFVNKLLNSEYAIIQNRWKCILSNLWLCAADDVFQVRDISGKLWSIIVPNTNTMLKLISVNLINEGFDSMKCANSEKNDWCEIVRCMFRITFEKLNTSGAAEFLNLFEKNIKKIDQSHTSCALFAILTTVFATSKRHNINISFAKFVHFLSFGLISDDEKILVNSHIFFKTVISGFKKNDIDSVTYILFDNLKKINFSMKRNENILQFNDNQLINLRNFVEKYNLNNQHTILFFLNKKNLDNVFILLMCMPNALSESFHYILPSLMEIILLNQPKSNQVKVTSEYLNQIVKSSLESGKHAFTLSIILKLLTNEISKTEMVFSDLLIDSITTIFNNVKINTNNVQQIVQLILKMILVDQKGLHINLLINIFENVDDSTLISFFPIVKNTELSAIKSNETLFEIFVVNKIIDTIFDFYIRLFNVTYKQVRGFTLNVQNLTDTTIEMHKFINVVQSRLLNQKSILKIFGPIIRCIGEFNNCVLFTELYMFMTDAIQFYSKFLKIFMPQLRIILFKNTKFDDKPKLLYHFAKYSILKSLFVLESGYYLKFFKSLAQVYADGSISVSNFILIFELIYTMGNIKKDESLPSFLEDIKKMLIKNITSAHEKDYYVVYLIIESALSLINSNYLKEKVNLVDFKSKIMSPSNEVNKYNLNIFNPFEKVLLKVIFISYQSDKSSFTNDLIQILRNIPKISRNDVKISTHNYACLVVCWTIGYAMLEHVKIEQRKEFGLDYVKEVFELFFSREKDTKKFAISQYIWPTLKLMDEDDIKLKSFILGDATPLNQTLNDFIYLLKVLFNNENNVQNFIQTKPEYTSVSRFYGKHLSKPNEHEYDLSKSHPHDHNKKSFGLLLNRAVLQSFSVNI